MKLMVLHGPSLNLLGTRETALYGDKTLEHIDAELRALATTLDVELSCKQSNHEGELIDRLQRAHGDGTDGVLLNAGAYAHTSLAIADAIRAIAPLPVVEVHLTNTAARGAERLLAPVGAACLARIEGFGWRSYTVALAALVEALRDRAR